MDDDAKAMSDTQAPIDNDFNRLQYAAHADTYLQSNSDGKIGGQNPEHRSQLLSQYLPHGRRVFEIGSAGGDDALMLQNAGYEVTASDYVEEFVTKLQEKGIPAIQFDAKKDEFPQTDALYANAVFVHFTPEEMALSLQRAKEKLEHEKIVFLSVIKGEGSERSGRARGIERDFYYYSALTLSEILQRVGFEILHCDETDPKWIQLICRVR